MGDVDLILNGMADKFDSLPRLEYFKVPLGMIESEADILNGEIIFLCQEAIADGDEK